FLELDPEDASYPKPEAMQPCEEDPLTVRPGVDWVDTDFDCTSDTVKVIYREWMAETRSGERCTASDTIVVLRLPALTGNEFVEMKEDSFYCELTPMSMMDPYSVDYNAWKQPIGIHDYEQPGSGLRGVIYDLPVLVLEKALADAQALDLEAEYLDQEILRKKNGVV
ncbi:hypothetical protein, partial [Membranihabitans maritimus]|uniref:hypothetical protein n=1 Tax=Membranihabitans maritimus TaxID=2904244 RepID=UPI001F1B6016